MNARSPRPSRRRRNLPATNRNRWSWRSSWDRSPSNYRHRWARLDLNLPERGTWPLESWRPALHEALYGLLGGAAQARPWQRITLNPALDARHGRLRLDILGQAEEGRRWLPAAVEAARRLAGWQGGRLLWHAQGAYWCVRLLLPLSPARR